MILVGVYAGLRLLSEALTLRWADVDLLRGLVTVQAAYAKSGKTRSVPLNRPLRAALAALRERAPAEADYVFAQPSGAPYRSIRTTFQTACRRAELKDVTPHVLRHTFASRLAWWLGLPRYGGALHPPEPDAQGRSRRADCPEFPDTVHDAD